MGFYQTNFQLLLIFPIHVPHLYLTCFKYITFLVALNILVISKYQL